MTPARNVLMGWLIPIVILMFNMSFQYQNYGGEYHCWLRMDTGLMYGQFIPIAVMTIISLTIIEAAGNMFNVVIIFFKFPINLKKPQFMFFYNFRWCFRLQQIRRGKWKWKKNGQNHAKNFDSDTSHGTFFFSKLSF